MSDIASATIELPAPPVGYRYKLVPTFDLPAVHSTVTGGTPGRNAEGRAVSTVQAGTMKVETCTEVEPRKIVNVDAALDPRTWGPTKASRADHDARRWERLR